MQLTTPLLLRKPCELFASVARVCQRQLGFLVYLTRVQLKITTQSKLNVLQRFCSAVLLFGLHIVHVKKSWKLVEISSTTFLSLVEPIFLNSLTKSLTEIF